MNGEKLLTVAEVAAELRLDPRTVRGWCRKRRLPALRVGGQWRIPRSWLEMKLKADSDDAQDGSFG
jgi:excisionase family DNA binding protein